MKGQTFIMGTVIFSGIMMLVLFSTGPEFLTDPESHARDLFTQSLEETPHALNQGLQNSESIDDWKKDAYSYESSINSFASGRGLEYGSYILIFKPDSGEAVFINYQLESIETEIEINGDSQSETVEALQSFQVDFEAGSADIELNVEGREHSHSKSTSGFIKRAYMANNQERWTGSITG